MVNCKKYLRTLVKDQINNELSSIATKIPLFDLVI